jgi:hypothetical protein
MASEGGPGGQGLLLSGAQMAAIPS